MDLHSGQLHKKFHETLDEKIAELQRKALGQLDADFGTGEAKPPAITPKSGETTPVPSIFKELKPSVKKINFLLVQILNLGKTLFPITKN